MRDKRCDIELLEAELELLPENIKNTIKEIEQLLEDEKQGIQRYPNKNMDIIELEKNGIPIDLRDLFDAQYSADKVVMPYEDIVSMIIEYTVQNEFIWRCSFFKFATFWVDELLLKKRKQW
ncbi:hypothetical protein [Butyrivibrio sp. FCS006]|uniref:hypothetical protein n=1 Tax=Butyrivibrio sp. FCS006 TaxID=1280684 RepID=UPI0003F4B13F|nr:hypothetical protein [Butyrivibrio sp. FCS006]